MRERALLVVDLQNDFLPGGALAVPDGDAVVPIANRLMKEFDSVIATQDWHPPDHVSFAANHPGHAVGDVIDCQGQPQVLWPVHCVQDTAGAEIFPDLNRDRIDVFVRKGTDPQIDSYSGFFDNRRQRATGLADELESRGVRQLYILGVATDYCVRATALDAAELDLQTFLVADACRGVELQPGDSRRATDEMAKAGVQILSSHEVLSR